MQGLRSHCGHPPWLTDTKGRAGSLEGKLAVTCFSLLLRSEPQELVPSQQLHSTTVPPREVRRNRPAQQQARSNTPVTYSAVIQMQALL